MKTETTLRWILVLVVASLPAVAAAEDYGGCFRVDLASPFVLPDGSSHDPGVLVVCTDRPLNPAAGMHRMVASGRSVGRLVSRRVSSEISHLDGPQAVFAREADGRLRLIGYAEPEGDRVRTFAFAAPRPAPGEAVLIAAN